MAMEDRVIERVSCSIRTEKGMKQMPKEVMDCSMDFSNGNHEVNTYSELKVNGDAEIIYGKSQLNVDPNEEMVVNRIESSDSLQIQSTEKAIKGE